ncbi:TonB family protein [Roseisolibacter agri]|uniref:TonB C-terminal domain-containing protein n=1 Tax=Roseisolibacter agri TaxID=2014610 RepID=A0AA37QFB9_9BACT|nr:TonB family protein [Roseisolibacter agri]GLC24698.1 hypothetical protein rosag_12110 [Roseisolibacter agri]
MQPACPPLPRDTAPVYVACQLDALPVPVADGAGPRYPEILRSVGVPGVVQATVVVDRGGRVRDVRVRSTTHELFTQATRAGARAMRFEPARRGGRAVAAAVPMEVRFLLAPRGEPARAVARTHAGTLGVRIAVGHEPVARVTPVPPLAADERRAVQRAVFEAMLPVPEPGATDPGRVTCLAVGRDEPRDPEPALVAALAARVPGLVARSACPRTYASMIYRVDSLGRVNGRPPGALDPTIVELGPLDVWAPGIVVARVRTRQGTGGTHYVCQAARAPDGTWAAACEMGARWVS